MCVYLLLMNTAVKLVEKFCIYVPQLVFRLTLIVA